MKRKSGPINFRVNSDLTVFLFRVILERVSNPVQFWIFDKKTECASVKQKGLRFPWKGIDYFQRTSG